MRTKKEIRETYKCQLSMNRIVDKLIQKARDQIAHEEAMGRGVTMTIKNVVDYAYDLQD